MFAPVQRQTVADGAFEQLATQIVDGHLAPGDRLPAERELAELLQVNRQAVREALKRLEQAGLVRIQPGGATHANSFRDMAGLDLLPRLVVRDGAVDPAVVRSIMELRACIGPDAARRCAERAGPDLVARLQSIMADMARPGLDAGSLHELDRAFWDAVVDGSDNIAYRLAMNSLRRLYDETAEVLAQVLLEEVGDIDDHLAVAAAIDAADADAAHAAARRLLARGTTAITSLLAATAAATTTTELST